MWNFGDGPRGRRALVAVALAVAATSLVVVTRIAWPSRAERMAAECDLAFESRAWDRVALACRDARWRERAQLANAWTVWSRHREDDALELAEELLAGEVATDAAYLAGYIRGQRAGVSEQRLAEARLQQALRGYQRAGRHAEASRAAGFLSRLAYSGRRFADELEMARLAVHEAEVSKDNSELGQATAALAEAYDWIGMEQAARDSFLRAEQLTEPWPAKLAHIYFKHAGFLLDIGSPHELETSLRYLDAAATMCDRTVAAGLDGQVSDLALAIRLNRADALSQLGRFDAADHEFAAAKRELGGTPDTAQLASIRLVEGYVAARRADPAAAGALFRLADDGSLESDYRWRMALELGRSHRSAGHATLAEQAYRDAITIIEELRGSAAVVELRPWVLARRTLPYEELLSLLVEQQRGIDALVVAESLHARAWLDVVLGQQAGRGTNADVALTAARIRQRLGVGSVAPLDAGSLMATIGQREALMFVTIGTITWRAHVVHGAVRFRRLPAAARELARRFRAAPGDAVARDQASAALIPPDLSSSGEALYVIATGPLADVPFAALSWGDRYLVDQRPVSRLPGLAALRCAPATWDHRAILLGDSRGDLAQAAGEVRQLAAAMGVAASLGPAASRGVLATARGADLLHIAAHSVRTPSGRAITLADGEVTAADVLDAGLDPRVAVLSGCATAASDDAESWDGFPSAFLAAGTRYVVATLRSLDDAAAARVIAAYDAQPAAMTPIERLAAAQRQLSGTVPVADWAGFAAWGSDACDRPPASRSIAPRASSSREHAADRATSVPSDDAGALPRGQGALPRRSGRSRPGGPHP